MNPIAPVTPIRILFVFASLTDRGDASDVRQLVRALDPARYRMSAIVCFRPAGMQDTAARRLEAAGVPVDRTPYHLSFEDTVAYLASRMPSFDVVVACQDVPDVDPAMERLHLRPALIRHDAPVPVSQWPGRIADALAARAPRKQPSGLFRSVLQGGFECSTHRRGHDRRRIDVIAASQHDLHAEHDYRELAGHGILTVRDGLRWHLIEQDRGSYDWSSLDRQLSAARATGMEVIWDLLHYGWPDDVDVWQPDFVDRFAAFAGAAARHIGPAGPGERRFYAPVNEISFLSWGGGDVGYMNPFATRRGFEFKVQLVRAAIAAMDAIRAVDPDARFVHADPIINVRTNPLRPQDAGVAEGHRVAQFQAWDMIAGKSWPQLGGRADLLDIVGINFYHNNQWVHGGATLGIGDALARPLRDLLAETYARYGRPIFIAETGIEGDARAAWLRMIMTEVRAAIAMGVPVEGVCLYPILDHPGWDDDRYCPNGLLRFSPNAADRRAEPALAEVIAEHRVGRATRPEAVHTGRQRANSGAGEGNRTPLASLEG